MVTLDQKLFHFFLLQVPFREIHNSLISDPVDYGLKDARDVENNIIISDYKLRSLLPPQQKYVSTIQGHLWLWMIYICKNYTFLITIIA